MSRTSAITVVAAGFAGLMALGIGFNHWLDRKTNAWAYATPSLTGSWQGEATAGKTRMKLVMTLSRDEVEENSHSSQRTLSGRATFCDSTGRAQSYAISGLVEDSHARETLLTFSAPPHETPGLRPNRMILSWDGGATLRG